MKEDQISPEEKLEKVKNQVAELEQEVKQQHTATQLNTKPKPAPKKHQTKAAATPDSTQILLFLGMTIAGLIILVLIIVLFASGFAWGIPVLILLAIVVLSGKVK